MTIGTTLLIDEQAVHAAMTDVADELALTTAPLEAVDRAAVARQPVSLATVYADLCQRLGIQPPAFVAAAID